MTDRRPCIKFLKGECKNEHGCDHWHPPVCHFWKKGECQKEKCSFLHMEAKQARAAFTRGASPKSKAKAKAKGQARAMLPKDAMLYLTPLKLKKLQFSHPDRNKARLDEEKVKHSMQGKNPRYQNKKPHDDSYDPPKVILPTAHENAYAEEWSRNVAYRRHCELFGANIVGDKFFIKGEIGRRVIKPRTYTKQNGKWTEASTTAARKRSPNPTIQDENEWTVVKSKSKKKNENEKATWIAKDGKKIDGRTFKKGSNHPEMTWE